MSNLKSIDRIKLEKIFEMRSGYVCNFSDRTFGDFVLENTGIDVYGIDKYTQDGTSKANRLRTFWKLESNYLVARLTKEMLEYWKTQKLISGSELQSSERNLYNECLKVTTKLESENPVEDIDAFEPNSSNESFSLLATSIKESIKKNEPNQALDRLHTFVVKYVRELCNKHSISYNKNTPLHSLFGGYVKFLREKKFIESEMSERILKSSISIFEAFNSVRNEKSFAHDNPILDYNESVLIFNNISNILRFIEPIEQKIAQEKEKQEDRVSWDDIEFSEEEIEAAGDLWIQQQIDIRRGK